MKRLFILLFVVFVAVSCKNKSPETTADSKNTSEESENTHNGKYALKNAVITYKSKVLGMEQKLVLTFDDYGNMEANDIYSNFMGVQDHSRSIIRDGFSYSLSMKDKTMTKMKISNLDKNIDFLNLTDDIRKKMQIKQLGKETFLNRECEKYSMNYSEAMMKGTFWVWKGIPLKSDLSTMGMNVVMEAVEVNENATIDPTVFDIPKDFKLVEMTQKKV